SQSRAFHLSERIAQPSVSNGCFGGDCQARLCGYPHDLAFEQELVVRVAAEGGRRDLSGDRAPPGCGLSPRFLVPDYDAGSSDSREAFQTVEALSGVPADLSVRLPAPKVA